MPIAESAMTTEAGPQLLRDCQTCFISPMTARDGAAFGSMAGSAGGATATT